jgi:predicted enzyme related to lactoylglutathione lyase
VPFWSAVLGFAPRPVNEQFVALDPPAGDSQPGMLFQKVPESKTVKNRVHVDLRADDMAVEVRRLVDLGATVIAERNLGSFRWTVLADPEGNEFCVNSG